MRVLGFVHLSSVLPATGPLLTGAAVLALALALGACGTPQRTQLTTAPITLPSISTAPSSPVATASPTRSPAGPGHTGSPSNTPPPVAPPTSTRPVQVPTAAAGTTASTVASPVAVLVDADCGNQSPTARPTTILLACADGSLRLEHLAYTSYGATSAGGHAVMHANTCRPDCAAGGFKDYPATIVLDHVVGGRFTEVTLRYAGPGPDGRVTASYPIQ